MNADILRVEAEARRLLHTLTENLPGDFGQVVRAVMSRELPDTDGASLAADPLSWAPRVLALCCQAYNQPVSRALPIGACLELLGVVSSVLDVVQDGHWDLLNAYGRSFTDGNAGAGSQMAKAAVISNVGVGFIGLAWQALLEHGPNYGIDPATVVEIGRLIASRWAVICQAQHQDLTIGRTTITLAEYDQIIEGKAGEIGGVVCEAGAILAGETQQERRQLWQTLGRERTIAHQLVDDYKDLGADLAHGQQISHPILYGLEVAEPEQRQMLRALLKRACSTTDSPATTQTAHTELLATLSELGARPYAESVILLHLGKAKQALAELALPAEIANELEQWLASVVAQDADQEAIECLPHLYHTPAGFSENWRY